MTIPRRQTDPDDANFSSSRGNGVLFAGLPVWARVTAVIGLPGAIALYLVYYVTTGFAQDAAQTRIMLRDHNVQVQQHVQSADTAHAQIQAQVDALRTNLWILCRSLAERADRAECRR